VLRGEDKG